jgi:hypothetical protein
MLSQQLGNIFFTLCEESDTPRSLAAWMLWKAGEWGQLVGMTTDPLHYLDFEAYRFHKDTTVTSLFAKYQDFSIPGVDRSEKIRLALFEDERQCERTNTRLRPYLHNSSQELEDSHVWESISRMRAFVRGVLGRLPDDIPGARFGQRATFGDKGPLTTVPDKLTSRPRRCC